MAALRPTRLVAVLRILTGVMFVAEGVAKITGKFVNGGFAEETARMAKSTYAIWRPMLDHVVLPHAALFSWVVAGGELLLGVSLVFGLLVRVSSIAGILLVLSIGLSTAAPEANASALTWITRWLSPFAYVALLSLFAQLDAGRTLGLDARR